MNSKTFFKFLVIFIFVLNNSAFASGLSFDRSYLRVPLTFSGDKEETLLKKLLILKRLIKEENESVLRVMESFNPSRREMLTAYLEEVYPDRELPNVAAISRKIGKSKPAIIQARDKALKDLARVIDLETGTPVDSNYLSTWGFSTKELKILERAGIFTGDDLFKRHEEGNLSMRGVGPVMLSKIKEELRKRDFPIIKQQPGVLGWGFSVRVSNALKKGDINTEEELLRAYRKNRLSDIKGLGKVGLEEVEQKLGERGFIERLGSKIQLTKKAQELLKENI